MLRSTLLRGGRSNGRLIAFRSRSEPVQRLRTYGFVTKRFYADKKPDETILPGSESVTKTSPTPAPPSLASTTPGEKIPPPQGVPRAPPTPQETATVADSQVAPNPSTPTVPTGTGSARVAPPIETPPPSPKKGRLRRLLFNLIILSTLGYGIGVYYALTSDRWHDLFTEYVPFGEEAVSYFEEREFRKRFLQRPQESRLHPQVRGEAKVTIPGRAGASAQTVEESDLASRGRHVSAVEESKPKETHPQTNAGKSERGASKGTQSTAHQLIPNDSKPEAKSSTTASSLPTTPSPQKSDTVQHIDNLNIEHASEPAVQDIVKILNDIITVINADNAGGKYGSTVDKAKGELSKVIADIDAVRQKEKKSTDEQLQKLHAEFDDAARELLRRSEEQMHDMEIKWREEYESERSNLSKSFETKLEEELGAANRVYDQKVKNELLKQAIALRKDFAKSVEDTVENERGGRLSKLDALSSSVSELEKLTGEWNSVVDSTLNTQHLLVAVEAARATLENADRPKPFTSELAALKEVAADNPIVNAAIASVNPAAYQRGIPTPAQVIDRFRRVASEVRKASLLPDNAGVASHAASILLSKVMFKKGGLPVGDDVESILTRSEVLLEEGNIEGAVQEMNSLNGWAKTLSRDWLVESRRVLEVQQALDVISTEARLRSLLVD